MKKANNKFRDICIVACIFFIVIGFVIIILKGNHKPDIEIDELYQYGEKLEGMDEVVVELIRCKTDNETLKQKIIDLNKELYQLKNDLNSYKPIGLGLYKKKERHAWE